MYELKCCGGRHATRVKMRGIVCFGVFTGDHGQASPHPLALLNTALGDKDSSDMGSAGHI